MSVRELGCCGAYCGKCRAFKEKMCRGCKTGYDSGERDIKKARCRIKVCCIGRGYESCADCPDLVTCRTINEFHGKKSYKYGKYRQAIGFIRENGYDEFIETADKWTNAYGNYK